MKYLYILTTKADDLMLQSVNTEPLTSVGLRMEVRISLHSTTPCHADVTRREDSHQLLQAFSLSSFHILSSAYAADVPSEQLRLHFLVGGRDDSKH